MGKQVRFCILVSAASFLAAMATVADDVPHRKAGWWQMTMKLPAGRILIRNLCLDATSDIRHNILQPADGCTMSATRISGGYNYKKVCQDETTTGTVIGDFNSAYTIEESRASMHIHTDARWLGVCPAEHHADDMWLE